jgi:hypothetical protein
MSTIRNFSASDIALMMQHISGIRMMLPNHIKLNPSERRSLFKLNSKKEAFVEAALKYMKTQPDTVPSYVDVALCSNYLNMYHQYSDLIVEMNKLTKLMEDVKVKIGNDVMNMTKAYFHNARFASQSGIKKAEPIYKQLKMNYAVGRNSKKTALV